METSNTTTTVFQAIQSMGDLPPLEESSLKPVMAVDIGALTHTVKMLWDAMREQRTLFQIMEKDATRKRTEQDVRIQNINNEMNSRIAEEARRRQQEDDRLRAEIARVRDDVQGIIGGIQRDMESLEGSVSSSVEATIANLKVAVANLQQRVTTLNDDVDTAKTGVSETKQATSALERKVDAHYDELDSTVGRLHKMWSVTREAVATAVANGTETEMVLQTPPLQRLARMLRTVEDKTDALRRDAATTSAAIADLVQRANTSETEVNKLRPLPTRVSDMDTDLRRLVELETSKLLERIADLEGRLANRPAVIQHASGGDTSGLSAHMAQLDADLASLRDRVTALESLPQRCSTLEEDVAVRATVESCQAMEQRLLALINEGHGRSQRAPSIVPTPAPPVARGGSLDPQHTAALLALKDAVDGLVTRMEAAEGAIRGLQDGAVSRDDLRQAAQETLKAAERAINHVYDDLRARIARLTAAGKDKDSTAGRFRCLSCNRDAGPLSEDLRDRLSRQQFPPSTTLLSREARESPSRTGSASARHAVPGQKEGFGGTGLTSSRRKLQNYYDWLQTKDGQPPDAAAAAAAASDGRRSTTPPRTTWLGAQSGGGGPGRQGGDHGSDDPDAIGSDGRYYTGVRSRPTSAAGSRPKSAPLRRAESRAAAGDDGDDEEE